MAYRDQERINNFKEKKKQRKLQKRSRDESSGSQSMYQAKDSIKTSVGSSQLQQATQSKAFEEDDQQFPSTFNLDLSSQNYTSPRECAERPPNLSEEKLLRIATFLQPKSSSELLGTYSKHQHLSTLDEKMLCHALRNKPELQAFVSLPKNQDIQPRPNQQNQLGTQNQVVAPKFVGYQRLLDKIHTKNNTQEIKGLGSSNRLEEK